MHVGAWKKVRRCLWERWTKAWLQVNAKEAKVMRKYFFVVLAEHYFSLSTDQISETICKKFVGALDQSINMPVAFPLIYSRIVIF